MRTYIENLYDNLAAVEKGIMNEASVESWLRSHPAEAERIIERIKERDNADQQVRRSSETRRSKDMGTRSRRNSMDEMFFEIARSLYSSLDLSDVVSKVLSIAVRLIRSEQSSMFLVNEGTKEMRSPSKSNLSTSSPPDQRLAIGEGIHGFVAETGKILNIANASSDPRFSSKVDEKENTKTQSILCTPIFASGDKVENGMRVLGVASLINKLDEDSSDKSSVTSFSKEDELLFSDFLFLVGIAINNSSLFKQIKEKENESKSEARKVKALLDIAKSLYSEDNTVDLCKKIIVHARDLTNADRASCFFVDKDANQLYSTIFDSATGNKIAFPIGKGIAGYVAKTGQPVNLKDVYEDARFNSEVDKATGYKTTSLLCVPILGPGSDVIGVTNLINKKSGDAIVPFTKDDEDILEAFSSFCGICIHKTLLLEEIKKSRMQVEMTLELMSYHAVARTEDLQVFRGLSLGRIGIDSIKDPDFDPHDYEPTDDRLVWIAFDMFQDLGFTARYGIPEQKLLIYILTVRKNYRNNAYHNFTHAVSVLHGVYIVFSKLILQPFGIGHLESFAMAVAALNHDIDHRGTNNQFQKSAQTALANFYSTSVMERHHFNHAMTILNSPGHNILDQLPAQDYKDCLSLIEHAILATDLALYFKNKARVHALKGAYDSTSKEHKELLRGLTMTCVDLSAMFKPWEKAMHIANSVYEEFFEQGDEEKKLGLTYSSEVMNRENVAQIPRMQVDFYDHIVTPAFESLHDILLSPSDFIIDRIRKNHENWRQLRDSNVPYSIGKKD
ncbi:hypothetical protein HDU97_002059 [Phlyctochytrium planicorne]|nr:hypothetical protein HDU97_002059 [Phlyctochytrium planicorne]